MEEANVLDKAREILKDRQSACTSTEKTLEMIAELWSAYLMHPVTAFEVANMMTLLKIARATFRDSYFEDDIVDAIGYLKLSDDIGQRG